MNLKRKVLGILAIVIFMATVESNAGNNYTLNGNHEFTVDGTSSVHDWSMKSEAAEGSATLTINNRRIESISSLEIKVPAKSLKSGRSGLDNNAYDALKADEHPEIRFVLLNVQSITENTIRARGRMNIAGRSRIVTIEVNYELSGNNVQFSGDIDLKLSDYDIERPTAMFGSVRAGDKIQVSFKTPFSATN
jgi:polyisoprenoid-binding protein YceI